MKWKNILSRTTSCSKGVKVTAPSPFAPNLFTMIVESTFKVPVKREVQFDLRRKWRIDYAIDPMGAKIALEVEGGAFTQGRHTRGAGFKADMEKYNALTVQGWKLIRVTPQDLYKTKTLDMIGELIKCR